MAHNTAGTLLRSASVAVGKKGGVEVEKLRARKVESSRELRKLNKRATRQDPHLFNFPPIAKGKKRCWSSLKY
jgi:hypothetical protein